MLLITRWYPVHEHDHSRTRAIKNIYDGLKVFGVSTVVVVPRAEFSAIEKNDVDGTLVLSVPDMYMPVIPRYKYQVSEDYGRFGNSLRFIQYNILYVFHFIRNVVRKLKYTVLNAVRYVTLPKGVKGALNIGQIRASIAELGQFDSVVIHGLPERHVRYLNQENYEKVSLCFHNTDIRSPETRDFLSKSWNRIDRIGFRSQSLYSSFLELGLVPADMPYHIVHSGVPRSTIRQRSDYRLWETGNILKLLCVSSLIPRKNVDVVLNVLALFNDAPWSLDIIGSGSETDLLKKMAVDLGVAEQVVFHGRMPHAKVMESFASYDVFVLLSERETFGMVYTEALSQGLVVIGTEGEGIDGVIIDGFNGFLADPSRPETFLDVLKKIIVMSPEEQGILKDNIYSSAMQLNEEKIVQDYYVNLIADR